MSNYRLSHLLAYVATACFFAYIFGTVWAIYPAIMNLNGAELFRLGKHLLVLAGISAWLAIKPKFGGIAAIAWGVVVPFEKYKQLIIELADGSLQLSGTFAASDVARLVLLLLGTCLAAAVVVILYTPTIGQPMPTEQGPDGAT